jgi:hypothetical protein
LKSKAPFAALSQSGCLKAMQASTSSVPVVSPEFPFAPLCSLKYAAMALKGNHSVNDSELKAYKGELLIAGKQRAYQLHVTERRHGAQFRANLLPEKFSQLFA